jgi:hypothetical protein
VSSLKAVWETVWGLLVDDGSLAIGIVVALGVTWLAAIALGDAGRDQVGWLLVAMLVLLVVVNLRAAGRSVRRRIS